MGVPFTVAHVGGATTGASPGNFRRIDRLHADLRVGWEPHVRIGGTIGFKLRE